MMFMMPQTSENPSATTARTPPARMPLTSICKKSVTAPELALRPIRRGVLGLRFLNGVRPNRHEITVLNLVDRHRLVDVDAAAVELEEGVERDDVEIRERIAHLLWIERARLLHGVLKRQARRGRFRIVVVGHVAVFG